MSTGVSVEAIAPSSPTSSRDGGFAKDLECVICQSVMIDPRVLNCQHAFCLRCLFGIVKRDRGSGLKITCPFRCHEVTQVGADIRALKRNTTIANLCVRLRKAAFDKRTPSDACDWCGEVNQASGSLTFCNRCGASTCAACDAKTTGDHRFLCCPPNEARATPFVVTPAFMTPWMAQQLLMDNFETQRQKARGVSQLAFEHVHLVRSLTKPPALVYVPGVVYDVQVNSPEHSIVFNVTLLANDTADAVAVSVAELGASPELSLLRDCTAFAALLQDFGEDAMRLACALTRLVQPDVDDCVLRHCLAIALALDAAIAVANLQFVPLLRQTIVVAHLLGLNRVDALQSACDRCDGTLHRTAIQTQMAEEIKLGMTLGGYAYKALNAALSSTSGAQLVSSALCTSAFNTKGNVNGSTYASLVDGISLLSDRISKLLASLLTAARTFLAMSDSAFDAALGSHTVEAEYREQFETLRRRLKELRAHVRLVCFSWVAAAGLQCQLGTPFSELTTKPLSVADVLSEEQQDVVNGVQRLIETLLPQISTFREQHAQLLSSQVASPNRHRDAAAQSLQLQLTQLMLQAVDLFAKDEIMKAQSFSGLFNRVKLVEGSLKESVKRPDQQLVSDAIVSGDMRQLAEVIDLIASVTPTSHESFVNALKHATKQQCAVWLPIVGRGQASELVAKKPLILNGTQDSIMDGRDRKTFETAEAVAWVSPLDSSSHPTMLSLPPEDDATSARVQQIAVEAFHHLVGHKRSNTKTFLFLRGASSYVLRPVFSGTAVVTGVPSRSRVIDEDQHLFDPDGYHGHVAYFVDGADATVSCDDPPRTASMLVVANLNRLLRRGTAFVFAVGCLCGVSLAHGIISRALMLKK